MDTFLRNYDQSEWLSSLGQISVLDEIPEYEFELSGYMYGLEQAKS